MPRTKQVRKRPSSLTASSESQALVKDFEYQTNMHFRKLETDFDTMIQKLENQIDAAISRIPLEIRKMTIEQLLNLNIHGNDADEEMLTASDDNSDRVMAAPSTVKKLKKKTLVKRQTKTSSMDDGYVTEGTSRSTSQMKHVSRIDTDRSSTSSTASNAIGTTASKNSERRTRSSTRSQTQVQQKVENSTRKRGSSTSRINNKMYFTPAASKSRTEYDCVTPKIKPNTPLNMLRRPKEGEMALSMQGSPLLVSAIIQERTANVNVPLTNGNIISLLPNDGLRLSHMPQLDAETMEQLKTLKGHIEKVIGRQ